MRLASPGTVAKAAFTYFSAVFAVAFLLGAFRVLYVAPRFGPLHAVLLEVPLVLAFSWIVAGRCLRRWPVTAAGPKALLAMGALAFLLLMLAEAGLAVLAFGQSPTSFLQAMGAPAGLLGLAGQIGFALIPALRGR